MRSALGAALAALTLEILAQPAAAQTTLRIPTSMNAGESFYVNMEKLWVPRLAEMTDDQLTIELAPAGAVVPCNETI